MAGFLATDNYFRLLVVLMLFKLLHQRINIGVARGGHALLCVG